MKTIASFTINHEKLKRGIYVSRKDKIGNELITTFDIRMKEPNREPVMDVPALHTIEHLGATFLRNDPQWGDKVVYFGPMGCRTGCYVLLAGDLESTDIVPLMQNMFQFIAEFKGTIPGTTPAECGNYLSHDLPMARWEANKFIADVLSQISPDNLQYPR